jgi:hypothetical protein
MPILVGLIAGQLFAEGERPFKVVNTVRVGYSDNLYRNTNNDGGMFVTDIIDLSFRATLSDRTDVTARSRINIKTETGRNQMYPNLYMMLNHSVSPRLLFGLSEYFRSGDKRGETQGANRNTSYDYFYNKVEGTSDYVLTDKDRLRGSLNYAVLRNDKALDYLDTTTIGAGLSWKRELSPQRTFMTLNLRPSRTTYDNLQKDSTGTYTDTNSVIHTVTNDYLSGQSPYYDAMTLSAGLSHTFNPEWQGHVEAGATYVQRHFSDSILTDSTTNSIIADTNRVDNSATLNPLLRAGLVYSPSPATRLTGDFTLSYQPSNNKDYGGQNSAELTFGAQHNLTAKLMAKATARFSNTKYSAQDGIDGKSSDKSEDRMDLAFRLTYKLNRIHFLEAGVEHREAKYDTGNSDWSENRIDIGWRVELN